MFLRLCVPAILAASFGLGCYVEHDHYDRPSPTTSAPAPPLDDTSSGTVQPLLVEIDTDKTMEAVGGEGVGIFVEYKSGGHWRIWWTCDSAKTQQECDFNVTVTTSNEFTNGLLETDATQVVRDEEKRLEVSSVISSDVSGITFDTAPGAEISIGARMGKVNDGSLFFFVQEGRVNGGYAKAITNPARFRGDRS